MLATPNGHKKVIVLLTDGVPTFSYKVSRVQTEADGRFTGHNLRIDKINQVALLISLVAIMRQIKTISINGLTVRLSPR